MYYTSSGRYFLLLVGSSILVLLFEILSWIFNGLAGPVFRELNIIFNFLFFLLNIVVPVTWLLYFDFKVYGSVDRLKKRLLYTPYIVITFICLIINLIHPWIYTIDEANQYTRLFGAFIYTIYIFLVIYSSLFFLLNNRSSINKNVYKAFFYFTLIPLAGAALQLLIPGSLLVWNAVALGITGSFVSLELFNVSRDFLTGLLNRRQFYEILEYKIYNGIKREGSFSIIMIDLNDFKIINDSFGHIEGDNALVIFANILRTSCKSSDHISRFGGDEFIVLLNDSSRGSIDRVINRIEKKVEMFNNKGIKKYSLSFSAAGIPFNSTFHRCSEDILHQVDIKMYENKKYIKEEDFGMES